MNTDLPHITLNGGTGNAFFDPVGWKVRFDALDQIGRIDWIHIYNEVTGEVHYSGPPRVVRNTTKDW